MSYKKLSKLSIFLIPSIIILSSCSQEPERSGSGSTSGQSAVVQNNEEHEEVSRTAVNQNSAQLSRENDTELSLYTEYLAGLDRNDLNSVNKAVTYYKAKLKGLPVVERDSAFVSFRDFYHSLITQYNESFSGNEELIKKIYSGKSDSEVVNFKDNLKKNGLSLLSSEGNYYVAQQPGFLYSNFSGHVSPPVKEYLAIRKNELAKGFSDDAALKISFAELGERVITWEKFINKNPDFILKTEAGEYFDLYLNTFLTGMDNSPVFDNSGKIRSEIKNLYYSYKQKYPNSKSGKLVANYYDQLARNNFIKSQNINDFYKENSIETMIGAQPPER